MQIDPKTLKTDLEAVTQVLSFIVGMVPEHKGQVIVDFLKQLSGNDQLLSLVCMGLAYLDTNPAATKQELVKQLSVPH